MNGISWNNSWSGYFEIHGQQIPVHLSSNDGRAQIYTTNRFAFNDPNIIAKLNKTLINLNEDSVFDLRELMEKHDLGTNKEEIQFDYELYCRLLNEIETIGWNKLVSIDSSLSFIEIEIRDKENRRHNIGIKLGEHYPYTAPVCNCLLPIPFHIHWSTKTSNLLSVIDHFEATVNKLQEYFKIIDDIDNNTWVLDPINPSYATTTRRISLLNHCSLQITIDPFRPFAIPECKLLGNDSYIIPLRDLFNKNLHQWNTDILPRLNLETILQTTFPNSKTSTKEEFQLECGICYSYRLETAVPENICDNSKCNKVFHSVCLTEWLRSIPTTRQSFDVLFGACPYCSTPISIKAQIT